MVVVVVVVVVVLVVVVWMLWGEGAKVLVVPCLGRPFLARIGAAIGKYDRGGAIGPPNRSKNDDRVGVICIGRLPFELRNLNGLIRTRFRNILIWFAPGSPTNTIFSCDFSRFGIFAWSATMSKYVMMRKTGLIGQRWWGWFGKPRLVGGWRQISLIVIGSAQIRGSWSGDQGAIGQTRDN